MNSAPGPLSTIRLFRLLLWAHGRAILARYSKIRREAPLLLVVLATFIIGYLVVGYWLFHHGLSFLQQVPLIGALLSQRILYLIFGFFFVMLVFSNLIIGYSTLFKSRETTWLLSLPVPHRAVYRWKFFESLLVSSWALLFLSAPMMLGYGQVHKVSPIFYGQVAFSYLPFVVIPALCGSWLIVLIVRVVSTGIFQKALFFSVLGCIAFLIWGIRPISDFDAVGAQDVVLFDQLLRHTRLTLNPFLPSAWLARSILAWTEGFVRQGMFFVLLLWSNALMGLLIGFEGVGRLYYGSWTAALSSQAARFQKRALARRASGNRLSWMERGLFPVRLFTPSGAALVLKDVRLFWRDPAQWIQFMIFFGLLCIYVLNLRNVAYSAQSPFWQTLISYLNLAACALTLSTLTTRFVFPQFSLEGRRLWILALAPIGLQKVVWQKFWTSCLAAMSITVSLMTASSLILNREWPQVLFFAGGIAMMSAALSGLAVGLGALFPSFREDNPSKIVSGFGGTLCLVISFIYIALFVSLSALPDIQRITKLAILVSPAWTYGTAIFLSALVLCLPLTLALRRVKNLEI